MLQHCYNTVTTPLQLNLFNCCNTCNTLVTLLSHLNILFINILSNLLQCYTKKYYSLYFLLNKRKKL